MHLYMFERRRFLKLPIRTLATISMITQGTFVPNYFQTESAVSKEKTLNISHTDILNKISSGPDSYVSI